MTKARSLTFAACMLAIAGPLQAAEVYQPTLMQDQGAATLDGAVVAVELPQEVIETEVEIGRVANSTYGGGLIGAMILSGSEAKKRETHREMARNRAESAAAPLRNELDEFDVHALAIASAREAMSAAKILYGDSEIEPSAQAPNGTLAFSYGLSPDFTQIRITADLDLRIGERDSFLLRQRITSIVELANRSYEIGENAEAWAANDAGLAKAALEIGFARLGNLVPQLIAMDAATFASLTDKKRPKTFAAGFYGPTIVNDNIGAVIWTDHGAVATQRIN